MFPTRKKSFNPGWIFWTTWVAITLSLSVFIVMYRSFSLRALIPLVIQIKFPVVIDTPSQEGILLDEKMPVVIISKNKTIFTLYKEIKKPTLGGSALLAQSISDRHWLESAQKILNDKNIYKTVESQTIGIVIHPEHKELKSWENIGKILILSKKLNISRKENNQITPLILNIL